MNGHPLAGVDLRLERADKHLAALDAERDAFFHDEHRRIVGHFEPDTSEYVFRVSGEPPNPKIGLVVAEYGHHLRAALDNLLWQLVLLRGGCPDRRTQFPIYESRERYVSSVGMLRGVSADDRALIKRLQPYNLGPEAAKTHPLAVIAWLNNTDKHRVLHVGAALPVIDPNLMPHGVEMARPAVMLVGKEGPSDYFPWWPRIVRDVRDIIDVRYAPITSHDRTELVRFRIDPCGPNPEMEMQGGEAVDVSLSDPQHPLMLHALRGLRERVGEIIEIFRPRFDL